MTHRQEGGREVSSRHTIYLGVFLVDGGGGRTQGLLSSPASLLFFVQLGNSLFHEEPLPYLVHQPLPWQVQYVTQSRRASRDSGVCGYLGFAFEMGRKRLLTPRADMSQDRHLLRNQGGRGQVQH